MKELIVLVLSGAMTLSSYEVKDAEKSKDSLPRNQILNMEEHLGHNAIHSTGYSSWGSEKSLQTLCELGTDK